MFSIALLSLLLLAFLLLFYSWWRLPPSGFIVWTFDGKLLRFLSFTNAFLLLGRNNLFRWFFRLDYFLFDLLYFFSLFWWLSHYLLQLFYFLHLRWAFFYLLNLLLNILHPLAALFIFRFILLDVRLFYFCFNFNTPIHFFVFIFYPNIVPCRSVAWILTTFVSEIKVGLCLGNCFSLLGPFDLHSSEKWASLICEFWSIGYVYFWRITFLP